LTLKGGSIKIRCLYPETRGYNRQGDKSTTRARRHRMHGASTAAETWPWPCFRGRTMEPRVKIQPAAP